MRVVLVGEVLRFRSFNGANKALPVLASSLHNAGFSDVVQLDLERPDVSLVDVCRHAIDSDLVAFVGCMTPQWPDLDVTTAHVYAALLDAGRAHVPIVVGGYATKNVDDIARASPWITAFFDGEGEDGIVQIAKSVVSGTFNASRRAIAGLSFVSPGGMMHKSTAPRTTALDAIDQGWGFVHVPHVHDMDIFRRPDGRQQKTAQLFTQRGCPWRCGYCNKSTEDNFVTRLGEEAMRSQLEQLRDAGFEAIYIDVDTFTVNRKAAEREATLLGQYGFAWGTNTRIDQVDQQLLTHCVEHGCVYMFFGVEHILPEVSVAIGKFNGPLEKQFRSARGYAQRVEEVFGYMRAAGLPSSYFIILGLPHAKLDATGTRIEGFTPTTFEQDMEAIRFGLDHCAPDYLNLNVLRFMPGSVAADAPGHPAYSCVRPSRDAPVTAGYFLPRVASSMHYPVRVNHPVYRLCESVGMNQPTTTALDAQRVFDTVRTTIDLINARIDHDQPGTRLFLERELFTAGLVARDEAGRYSLAPLRDWEGLKDPVDAQGARDNAAVFERVARAARSVTSQPC
jgi:radical SAM superfamily enzyme YgiQ (UPF0313 family)